MCGNMDYQLFLQKINNNEPFHFARYGDGEFYSIWGKKGSNVDGHSYNIPGMGDDLRRTLTERKDYFYGLQPLIARKKRLEIDRVCGRDFPWVNADVLHDASAEGKLWDFIDILKNRSCVFVGQPHLLRLDLDWNVSFLIKVPARNCYAIDRDGLGSHIILMQSDFVVFCAGFLSNIMIWNLHEKLYDRWLIDAGSVFDPYCGINSRTYHSKVKGSRYQ